MVLEQTNVVLVDIDLGKGVLEQGVDHLARTEEVADAIGALAENDILFGIVALAVDLLRDGLIDRQGEYQLSRFGGFLHVLLEEGHTFELAFFKDAGRDVGEGKAKFVVLLDRIIVALLEIAHLLGSDDLLHQFHGGIVFARILGLLRHDLCFPQSEIGGFEAHDETIATGGSDGLRFVANGGEFKSATLAISDGELALDIRLGNGFRAFVKDIDEGGGFTRLGIEHTACDMLRRYMRDTEQ